MNADTASRPDGGVGPSPGGPPDPAREKSLPRRFAGRVGGSAVARQVGGLTGSRAVAAALSFLWLAIAARSLSLPEFADLALLLSVGAITSVAADWGLPLVLNEALAAEPARGRATLFMVIRWRMVLAVAAALVTALLYLLAANDPEPAVPAIFATSLIASAWYTSCSAALRGAVSVVPEAVNEVLSRLFVLVVGATLVVQGAGLVGAVLAYALADLVSAVALTVASCRLLSGETAADRVRFRIRRILPLGLAAVAGVVYYRIDVWLLALTSTASEVARYSVSYRILDVLIIPAGALAVVSIGATARLDNRAAVRKADRMAGLLCLCVLPAVIVLEVLPEPLLRLAFGSLYGPGAPVLRILALAVLPSLAALAWAPLVALRGTGLLAVTAGCLVANVALNLTLIPRFGAEGAAAATVLGQVAFAMLLRRRLRRLQPYAEPAHDGADLDLSTYLAAGQS